MIAIFVIGLILLALFNSALLTGIITNFITLIIGDDPLSRLTKIILGAITLIGYAYITIYKILEYLNSTDGSSTTMIILLAIPLALVAIIYIAKGNK